MKTIPLLLMTLSLFAQAKHPATEEPKEAAISISEPGSRSVIIIPPQARAKDIVQAFNFLRKDKPTKRIMVHTGKSVLYGVSEIQASQGGTLLMIKMLSNQGPTTQVVPVEQIMEIGYSP